jgi:uncharacterized protein YidB (DUF937 family)
MGLLDNLENMALGKVGGSNPEVAAVLEMIQNHPGGVSGLVETFHSNGLGGVVNSWIGNGQNQAVSPDQIQQALGSAPVQALAQRLGVSPEQASATLSQLLPTVIDKLSPNGAAPDHSNLLQMGENLLSSLGKTGTS